MSAKTSGHEAILRFVFLLAFIGFGTKAALFPMYAWLPAASVAPTPVTALLHAVAVVNAGAFAVLRVIYYSFGTSFLYGSTAQIIAVCLSLLHDPFRLHHGRKANSTSSAAWPTPR